SSWSTAAGSGTRSCGAGLRSTGASSGTGSGSGCGGGTTSSSTGSGSGGGGSGSGSGTGSARSAWVAARWSASETSSTASIEGAPATLMRSGSQLSSGDSSRIATRTRCSTTAQAIARPRPSSCPGAGRGNASACIAPRIAEQADVADVGRAQHDHRVQHVLVGRVALGGDLRPEIIALLVADRRQQAFEGGGVDDARVLVAGQLQAETAIGIGNHDHRVLAVLGGARVRGRQLD